MTFNRKRIFKVNEPSDFKKIFEDNGIIYSTNTISEQMSVFLYGKKIIFEEGFFPISLDGENIRNIFNNESVTKIINDDNSIKYLSERGSIYIKNTTFKNEEITLKEKTELKNCQFNNITINSQIDKNNLYISETKVTNIFLSNISSINSIKLENIEEIGELKIENINNINLLDINVKKINKLTVKDSSFDGKNYGIRNSKIISAELYNTNLGEFKFNGVNFINLGFKYTTFNDCTFNNTNLPEYLDEKLEKLDINIDNIEQKDNYRQLKHVMDSNANYIEGNKFYALEMESHRLLLNNLNHNKGFFYNLTNSFFGKHAENGGKLFILNILSLINEFGNNISRNIFMIYLYLILSTIISFWCNKIVTNDYSIEFIHIFSFITLILGLYFLIFVLWGVGKLFKTDKVILTVDNIFSSTKFTIGFHIIIIIYFLMILNIDVNRFYGIHTFTYLANPFSGLTYNSINSLLWSEQIGLIIHKIIYGTIIYQLIITLKRTTKR